jgi:hypothetical protein
MQTFVLDPNTHPGSVHLTVSDLERSLRFYDDNSKQRA